MLTPRFFSRAAKRLRNGSRQERIGPHGSVGRSRPICAGFERLEAREMLAGEPVLQNIESLDHGPHSVEIAWQTDVSATTEVHYGVSDVAELESPFYHSLVTEHKMVIAGLSPEMTYSFQVASTDAEGDTAMSEILEFTTTAIPSAPDAPIVTGGLTSYPVEMIGPNLLANPSFEHVVDDDPVGWWDNGFTVDDSVARTGSRSYRITDAHTIRYSQSARQTLALEPGSYRVGAWVKLEEMAENQGNGVRVGVSGGSTSIIQGTSDWQFLESTRIVSDGGPESRFSLQLHAEPDSTAWFDDAELRREFPASVEVFMRYPNYRGILFDDQSQTIDFDVKVRPPKGTDLSDYAVEALIIDEADGTIVGREISAAMENGTVTFDGTDYVNGHTYLARFLLVRQADGATVYEYPAYRISKMSGDVRATMATSFDEHNRFLVYGEPTFILGAYDSGLGYTTREARWESYLTEHRRLFELPINYYLNYWYGGASAPAMTSLMNVLQEHGIQYLQTGNAFAGSYNRDKFLIHTDDDYTATLAEHPGFAGLYAADEPIAPLADEVFEDYQRMKAIDPDGVTFGVSNRPRELDYWRDAVDILSTDPYPMYGAEPTEGYPFSNVAKDTIATREAVQDSRPFVEVLQYFKFTSKGRWPTQSELRNMSYMAIAEGANGLFYWSLGAGALAYVESGWGPTKTELFDRLLNVTNELADLNPGLVGLDAPELLNGVDNAKSIRTRVKVDEDGVAYIIAYNNTNLPTASGFHLDSTIAAESLRVHGELRSIPVVDNAFSDYFAPYQAHVYVIGKQTDIVGHHVFYNGSQFDGNDSVANAADDEAIASDKAALLPGEIATTSNYTSYDRGINGIMVDIAGLARPDELSTTDFRFRVGNSEDLNDWSDAPPPQSISVREGAGDHISDRVTIIWPDNAIEKQWLQVIVKATDNTGLAGDDVFYFGNAIGEAGNSATNAIVNMTDEIATRNFLHSAVEPALIDDPYDHNRDGVVDATDQIIARDNQTNPLTMLRLIAAPAVATTPLQPVVDQDPSTLLSAALDWQQEYESTQSKRAKNQDAKAAVDLLLATDWA